MFGVEAVLCLALVVVWSCS